MIKEDRGNCYIVRTETRLNYDWKVASNESVRITLKNERFELKNWDHQSNKKEKHEVKYALNASVSNEFIIWTSKEFL
jgi:hypothetical protein